MVLNRRCGIEQKYYNILLVGKCVLQCAHPYTIENIRAQFPYSTRNMFET